MSLTDKEAEEFAARRSVWTNTLDALIRQGGMTGEAVTIATEALQEFDKMFKAGFEKDQGLPKRRKTYTRKAKVE